MSIEMAGGVYCPLSPRDPDHRLHALVEQTQSRLVLIHSLTHDRFNSDLATVDIDAAMNGSIMLHDADLDFLSNTAIGLESVAYIIFTSGSTGTPKAVSFFPRNLCHP